MAEPSAAVPRPSSEGAPAPDHYRVAFLIAALTGMRAICWPPEIWEGDFSHHATELIFGFMLVQLFGFMLKALPRWIGQPIIRSGTIRLILATQALAFVIGCFDLELGAQLRAITGLVAVIALFYTAIRARGSRTYPLLALAAAHAGSGMIAAFVPSPAATMAGFSLILAICFEVGNRIFPMVIDAGRLRNGLPSRSRPPAWLSLTQRVTSLAALFLFAFNLPYALLAFLAGASGLAWMRWVKPWQAFGHGGLGFMTFAMATKRIGFLLLAAEAVPRSMLSPAVAIHVLAIHVLAIGGLASLAVAIATSIIRKRNGQSFGHSRLGFATYACLTAALAFRIAYTLEPGCAALLTATQVFWLLGFAGYALLILRRPGLGCAGR